MAEGELLSKRQLAQESTMKKLRQHIKDVELSRKELAADLTMEREKVEQLQAAKQKLEADVAAAKNAHRVEVESERAHYEGLLAKSRSAQVLPNLASLYAGPCSFSYSVREDGKECLTAIYGLDPEVSERVKRDCITTRTSLLDFCNRRMAAFIA